MSHYKRLLRIGYFPKELPPCFTTESFAKAMTRRSAEPPDPFGNPKKTAQMCTHNLARQGTIRRTLGIPNPVPFSSLCRVIDKAWTEIQNHLQSDTWSLSTPVVDPRGSRAFISKTSFNSQVEARIANRRRARYVLKADISRFYPSLYTHSIPWALHGKTFGKRNRKAGILGNDIDLWCRNLQDGQTIGIPIGPDTSLVIAEIVLQPIALDLAASHLNLCALRQIDDFEFGVPSQADAEDILASLMERLGEFELHLNPKKTEAFSTPLRVEEEWIAGLRAMPIRKSVKEQREDLIRYFDQTFQFAQVHADKHVVRYALGRFRYTEVLEENWSIFRDLLFQSVSFKSGCLPDVLRLVSNGAAAGRDIDEETLSEIIADQIKRHARQGHGSEVAWALWGALNLGIGVQKDAAEVLAKFEDSVVALLALDALDQGLLPDDFDPQLWKARMTTEDLWGKHWLLSYEANVKCWLQSKSKTDHVDADPAFGWLKKNGVSFYEPVARLGFSQAVDESETESSYYPGASG